MTGGRGREREAKCDELPAATQQEAEETEQEREPPPSPLRRGEDEGQKKGKKIIPGRRIFFVVSVSSLNNKSQNFKL